MQIKWYEGEQVPLEIEELNVEEDKESDIEYGDDDSDNDFDDMMTRLTWKPYFLRVTIVVNNCYLHLSFLVS